MIALLQSDAFPVGTKLPSEREMAERFKASRNTVRGALRTIAASGALEIRRSSGHFLVSRSALESIQLEECAGDEKKKISEQLEAFFLLEPAAVVLATQRISREGKKELEECVVRLSNAVLVNDIDEIVDSHRSFHRIIAACTQNRSIQQMLERLDITYVLVANVMAKLSPQERNSIFARHVNLYKAIKTGNAEAARKMSLQMILSTSLLLNKFENIAVPNVINKEITDQIIDMKQKRSEEDHD